MPVIGLVMLLTPIIYCCLSGLMLALATPSIGMWPLAFVAFIPLLLLAEKKSLLTKIPFIKTYFSGFLFSYTYLLSCFYWIANMSWLALIVAAAVYSFVYALFVPGIILGVKAGLSRISLAFWVVFLWISLEVLLSDLFLPIPSAAIGYLIWPLNHMIQISNITGVFGVSFWVIAVNVLFSRLLIDGIKKNISFLAVIILCTCLFVAYGFHKPTLPTGETGLTINTVYTSVLSEEKNNQDSRSKIFEELKQETLKSIEGSEQSPDLVIWPETSVPVFLRSVAEKEFVMGLLELAQNNKVPILTGALSFQLKADKTVNKYNSAFLIPEQGFISQEYKKKILAPFTEYNPLEKIVSRQLHWPETPKFNAGKEPGIIRLYNKNKFGVVICYEVFFPDLVRKAAGKNSGFIVNITNDHHAFAGLNRAYKIPLPHLIFRAVENHKFLVRSANWGYSMVISPRGEIIKTSSIGTTGSFPAQITPNNHETFFSIHGLLFAKALLMFTLCWAILLFIRVIKKISKK